MTGDPYGVHRVISPRGALPQAAEKLDADMTRRFDHEIHIDVETLNVDSASMRQLGEEQGGSAERVGKRVLEIVNARGKLHNPITGSGGMLLGRVAWVGRLAQERWPVLPGDRVATLVSLTLTPLAITRIIEVAPERHQVDIEGKAVLFTSGSLAKLPEDLPHRVVLSALDVAGAAPQVSRLAMPGGSVLVLGAGGKSGILCAAAARKKVGTSGVVVGVEQVDKAAQAALALGYFDHVLMADAQDPVAMQALVFSAAPAVARQGGFDLVVSCVNCSGAEMSAILLTRERGRVYFFSMATSFTRAALGAEGVSRDIDMLVGNGYCHGHAEATLALVREDMGLRQELERRLSA